MGLIQPTLFRAKTLAALLVLLGIVLLAWGIGALRATNPLLLQACLEVESGARAWICRQSLYRLHPTREEVEELNSSAGVQFPVGMDDANEATSLLRHYLKAGVDINAVDQRSQLQWTALHSAAFEGRLQAVQLLIAHGADVKLRDARGKTPLDLVLGNQDKLPPQNVERIVSVLSQGDETNGK
ncbi:ankyrin repeat domain-containing protein [Azonexus sp.]|uniref:ankyrin repeat domain-containing protein n=1 Tax=Azonexus sp. TaxID=1872668 RepID=UPI0035B2608B